MLEEFSGRKTGDLALFTHPGINGAEAANRENGFVLVRRTVRGMAPVRPVVTGKTRDGA